MSNWKGSLSAERKEFDRLQAMDAALGEEQIAADIDKILNQKRAKGVEGKVGKRDQDRESKGEMVRIEENIVKEHHENDSSADFVNACPSPEIERAPETTDRYTKAKVSFMTKQLADAAELRKKLEEQVRDLQRQLKTSREENGNLKKRVQQVETEMRRTHVSKRGLEVQETDNLDTLQQEITVLKKDVITFERMAKVAEENSKNKEGQLKRALDTISRLKSQLQESQQQVQNSSSGEKAKVEALENRLKLLEKQRTELVDGFRKQMKLIDVLKRQKVHLEAARLLAFSEEEFMKALEWRI